MSTPDSDAIRLHVLRRALSKCDYRLVAIFHVRSKLHDVPQTQYQSFTTVHSRIDVLR